MNQVLRGSSYTFPTAMADLIDNCIEAMATEVYIDVDLEEMTVIVSDNGLGMSDAIHAESMRVASETRDYESDDLGKFGTGMKAASLSQANRLVVGTRDEVRKPLTVRCLDMEHIAQTNDWDKLTLVLEEEDLPEKALARMKGHSGTVVVWQNLDRVFQSNSLSATAAKEQLRKQLSATEEHVGMVFHRFLQGSIPGRKALSIYLNDQAVIPWDPFVLSEPKPTEVKSGPEIQVGTESIKLTSYILPGEKEFSSKIAFKDAGGPSKWLNSQGFWVYRNNRLIKGGGWLKIRSSEEHVKLARIALDFPSSLDELLKINVAKSYVELPLPIRKELEPFVTAVSSRARKRYADQSRLFSLSTGALPSRGLGGANVVQRKMTARALAELLGKVAVATNLQKELDLLAAAVREQNAQAADEVGW